MPMEPVLTVTLNPSLDVMTSAERLMPGQKLRCDTPHFMPGGGGINVSRAIKELGGDSCALVALAGSIGQQVRTLCDDVGINTIICDLRGETRISFKVMEKSSNQQYRFNLPGPEQVASCEKMLLSALSDCIRSKPYRFVVASGSLPPGLPEDLYGKIAKRTRELGAKLILDTSGIPLKAALSSRPFLIKPNRYEAQALLQSLNVRSSSIETLAQELLAQGGPEVIIITHGADGAIVITADMQLRLRPPKVVVRSAVGAGDSFIGALTFGLANGWSLADASRYGVAAAASAVGTDATALCDRDTTQKYFEEIAENVEQIS